MSKTSSVVENDLSVESFSNDGNTYVSDTSLLNQYKSGKSIQWWFFGPVLLAIILFLLMGTVFERRIEALWRRTLQRRQAVSSQGTDYVEPQTIATTNSLHAFKTPTPSEKSIASFKGYAKTKAKNIENMDISDIPDINTLLGTDLNNLTQFPKNFYCEGENFNLNSSSFSDKTIDIS